jgi:type IV pilus assembly protein PilA
LREVSRNSGVDPGVMTIVAAIAIPNLLRARIAANEASAVATLRTANVAQVTYMASYPQRGYARDFAALGPDPHGADAPTAQHAHLIDSALGNPGCTAASSCEKAGFQFRMTALCGPQRCTEYVVVATPASSSTGTRSFCSTSDAVIRVRNLPTPAAPITAAMCKLWRPLQQ